MDRGSGSRHVPDSEVIALSKKKAAPDKTRLFLHLALITGRYEKGVQAIDLHGKFRLYTVRYQPNDAFRL
jgi:hypothetical protein